MMDPVALPTPGSDLGHSIRQDSTVSAPVPTSPGIAINFIGGPGHVQSDATDRPALTSSA